MPLYTCKWFNELIIIITVLKNNYSPNCPHQEINTAISGINNKSLNDCDRQNGTLTPINLIQIAPPISLLLFIPLPKLNVCTIINCFSPTTGEFTHSQRTESILKAPVFRPENGTSARKMVPRHCIHDFRSLLPRHFV